MAWEAVVAWVTTPAVTSAVSGTPGTDPEPTTVMDGAGPAADARDAAGRNRAAMRATARRRRMAVRIPSRARGLSRRRGRGGGVKKNPPAPGRRRRDYEGESCLDRHRQEEA